MSHFGRLLERAGSEPDATFFSLKNAPAGDITFAMMRDGIARAAHFLELQGVRRGDIIFIFAQHSRGKLFAFFGAQLIGAIPAFMPPPTSRQPLDVWFASHRAVIERAQPKVIISEERCIDQVRALGTVPVVSTAEVETAPAAAWPDAAFDGDAVAFLQHSSGTTGLKKGVMVTYRQLEWQIEAYANAIGFDPAKNCVVSWLPVYHDMGLIAATLLPFVMAAPVHVIDTFEWLKAPASYIDLLVQKPASFSWLPNFAYSFMAQRCRPPAPGSLASVAGIINCSEPCKEPAMEAFRQRFAPAGLRPEAVQICYAMAEYVFAVTQTDATRATSVANIDAAAAEAGVVKVAQAGQRAITYSSVGRAIPGTEIKIDSGPGTIGEVLVSGPCLCNGYLHNPEETANNFRDGWYYTRDLGFILDGELHITGRKDDLMIIRGRNIYAHDIEALVNDTGRIKPGRVVAFGIHDEALGTQEMVILAESDADPEGSDAEKSIRSTVLDIFGISPADIVLVPHDTLIKTTSGKISRSENMKRYVGNALATWR